MLSYGLGIAWVALIVGGLCLPFMLITKLIQGSWTGRQTWRTVWTSSDIYGLTSLLAVYAFGVALVVMALGLLIAALGGLLALASEVFG